MFQSFKFDDDAGSQTSDVEKDSNLVVGPSDHSEEQLSASSEKNGHVMREKAVERKSIDKTAETQGSPKRTFASVMSDIFRRTSDTSNSSDPPSRKTSHNNVSTARAAASALGLFKSHNPDVDSEEADAAIPRPRKFSTQSAHSGEEEVVVPEIGRRPSYMPRNACASFLKTATGTSEDKPAKEAAPRKPSIMGIVPGGDAAHSGVPSGRRPSGLIPNNVASRYVRSASMPDEEKDAQPRRGSGRSRQGSNETTIKPVSMLPDQFNHWQNSVQRNNSSPRVTFSNTVSGANGRQSSIEGVKEDLEEDEHGVVQDRNNLNSPTTQVFGPQTDRDLGQIDEDESRPETPLESLGFKGAVPTES